VLLWSAAVVLAAAVGWSRWWLGVHWPTDVLGGWAVGAAWCAAAAALTIRLRR
jgi:undecaprenyl-diphosphatase